MNTISIVIPTLTLKQGNATGRLAQLTAGCKTHLVVSHNEQRQGFTRTVNAGMERAPEGNDICILNDDIEHFPLSWLATLQKALYKEKRFGIACPSGNSSTAPMKGGRMGMRGVEVVAQIPFWCALLKRTLVDEIGHLDPAFIHYASDNWYCHVARRKGWKLIWVKDVYLEHTQHGSGLIRKWRDHDQKLYRRRLGR